MAETLGNLFQQAAERYLHENCLLKLVLSGNKTMAQAGHNAILCILQHVTSPKLLMKIVDAITRKNPILRNKCSAYLQSILTYFPISTIEKYSSNVENGISIALNDASADTRAIGRECYNLYEDIFPEKAKKLYDTLPSAVQKAIISHHFKENKVIPKKEFMSIAREIDNSSKENVMIEKEVSKRQKLAYENSSTLGHSTPHDADECKPLTNNYSLSFDSKETKVHNVTNHRVNKPKTLSINEVIEIVGSSNKSLTDIEFKASMEILIDSLSNTQTEVLIND